MLDGQARLALAAADVVLVASGTATLETALSKRPMVVAYRLGAITAFMLRTLGLVKIKHFSQPNLLAGAELVPEFFQGACEPGKSRGRARALARGPGRRWRGSRRSSRASTRGCAATARNAPRPKSPSSSTARGDAVKVRVRLRVAGVDEAGRGPLAGPVVAAAVILNPMRPIRGLADSKVLEPEERERLAPLIRAARVVLRGGLGGRRGDRQHQHPAGDDAGDAPRIARPRNRAAAGVRRRQSLSVSGRARLRMPVRGRHKGRCDACRRSARLRFSRRPRATRSCAISTGDIRASRFQGTRDIPRLRTWRRSTRSGPARCTGAVFRRCAATSLQLED